MKTLLLISFLICFVGFLGITITLLLPDTKKINKLMAVECKLNGEKIPDAAWVVRTSGGSIRQLLCKFRGHYWEATGAWAWEYKCTECEMQGTCYTKEEVEAHPHPYTGGTRI